ETCSSCATDCGACPARLSYVLDDFEQGMRVVQPGGQSCCYPWRDLWNQDANPPLNDTVIIDTDSVSGAHAVRSYFPGGPDFQFQFGPFYEGSSEKPTGLYPARMMIQSAGPWQTGRINRLRFWAKLPTGFVQRTDGDHSVEVGTYVRLFSCGIGCGSEQE